MNISTEMCTFCGNLLQIPLPSQKCLVLSVYPGVPEFPLMGFIIPYVSLQRVICRFNRLCNTAFLTQV